MHIEGFMNLYAHWDMAEFLEVYPRFFCRIEFSYPVVAVEIKFNTQ